MDESTSLRRRFWPSVVMLIVFGVSQVNLGRIVGPLSPNFFAMQFAHTPARYHEILTAWGPEGLSRYRSHFSFDLIHPLIFGLLGVIMVRSSPIFAGLSPRASARLALLLPMAAIFDYVENWSQLQLLSHPYQYESVLVPLSALYALLKWVIASVFVCISGWRSVVWCLGKIHSERAGDVNLRRR